MTRRDAVSDWGDTHVFVDVLLRLNSDFYNLLFVLNTRNLENFRLNQDLNIIILISRGILIIKKLVSC